MATSLRSHILPYVTRFLIIHSEGEGKDISLLSPFLIHKTIMSMAGEPKSIKNLRSGDLLIQCAKEPHEKSLLKMKTFCGLKCSVTPHKSFNTSKGILRVSIYSLFSVKGAIFSIFGGSEHYTPKSLIFIPYFT